MLRIRWALPLVPIVALAATLATAGPASAVTGSIQIGPTVTIVARVALDVPVTASLTCDQGFDFGEVVVDVEQARGTSVVSSEGQAAISSCTGGTQNVTVQVIGVFHGGAALAFAHFLQCTSTGGFCAETTVQASQQIMIRGG
jgi:hypothetical protein